MCPLETEYRTYKYVLRQYSSYIFFLQRLAVTFSSEHSMNKLRGNNSKWREGLSGCCLPKFGAAVPAGEAQSRPHRVGPG